MTANRAFILGTFTAKEPFDPLTKLGDGDGKFPFISNYTAHYLKISSIL